MGLLIPWDSKIRFRLRRSDSHQVGIDATFYSIQDKIGNVYNRYNCINKNRLMTSDKIAEVWLPEEELGVVVVEDEPE
jgi:hypothetical protein